MKGKLKKDMNIIEQHQALYNTILNDNKRENAIIEKIGEDQFKITVPKSKEEFTGTMDETLFKIHSNYDIINLEPLEVIQKYCKEVTLEEFKKTTKENEYGIYRYMGCCIYYYKDKIFAYSDEFDDEDFGLISLSIPNPFYKVFE